jgi:hypothetical protein
MSDGDEGQEGPSFDVQDRELQQMLGLFDAPAFARRGREVEGLLERLQARCRAERDQMLDMVRLRLAQWSASSTPDSWSDTFVQPIDALWELANAPGPMWAATPSSRFRRRGIARDLIASVGRFNGRWDDFLASLRLDTYNRMVEQYNRYYVLEKEILLGSARLATRHFVPKPPLAQDDLKVWFPPLPLPELKR